VVPLCGGVGPFELPLFAEELLGIKGCAFSRELLNVEESEVLPEIPLETGSGFTLTSISWTRAARTEVVWVSTTDVWPEDTLRMSFRIEEVETEEVVVKVAGEVTVTLFPLPGVTPPQALKEALW
jgi:hypothetical protein